MKLLKRMAVLSLVVLALGGCTKSSLSTDAPVSADGEMDPGKMDQEEDETLPRSENKLIEDDETQPATMYDWDQVKDETDALFADTNMFPQSAGMTFTADEDAKSIVLTWNVKNDTTAEDAMDYAASMVKQFNDIVAIQSMDLENSTADSFGTLWNDFALTVKIVKEDGTAMIEKNYKAGDKIDLVAAASNDEGPKNEEENVVKKIDTLK